MQVAKSGDFRQGSISAIEPSYNTTFCKLGQGFVSPGMCFIRVVFNVCIIITIKGHNSGHDMEPLSMATMKSLGEIYSIADKCRDPCDVILMTVKRIESITLAARTRAFRDVSIPTMCSNLFGSLRRASKRLPDPHPRSTWPNHPVHSSI